MARGGGIRERAEGLFGTPSRFMQPRLVLIITTFVLVAFGLLMIYSSSSIVDMASEDFNNDAAYHLKRQLGFVAAGGVAAIVLAISDYHLWSRSLLPVVWVATVGLLLLVFTGLAGREAYGATRWIDIGPFNLQPSEFAKITIVLVAAYLGSRCFEEYSMGYEGLATFSIIGLGLPLVLIVLQPDKGTTIICAATIFAMAYLAGVPRSWLAVGFGIGVAGVLLLAFKDEYSRSRVFAAVNPWNDPYGAGYQLIQGFYAFSCGGLFGVGVGLSGQKYSYLPMAYNDFIFPVIGEELGLVGTLGVVLGFCLLVWAGLQIARYAPDLSGRLVAGGCTIMLLIQFLVNVGGVLGMIPLTGKPLPFLSYGGSSIVSCLLLVGFVASVSLHSALPETAYERSRRSFSTEGGEVNSFRDEYALVGEATPRSARPAGSTSGFSVVSGSGARVGTSVQPGRAGDTSVEGIRASRAFSEAHSSGRVTTDASGRRRIDLGPSASDRLRSSRGKSN